MPLFDRRAGPAEEQGERVFRVGEINRSVKGLLERTHGDLWLEGEVSDVRRSGPGHVYFVLKDEQEMAQLSCVMFQSDVRRARATLERGAVVRLRGCLSIHEPRGTFQLIARIALPAGRGDLHAQFERLRRKLAQEGLFAPERKRALPRIPRVVGVVTSTRGAAMHDIVRVARGRYPVRIVVAHCRVQGDEAPREIVEALINLQRHPAVEVIIVARGGGSGEDLWAFNHEAVARTIAECRVPTVTGIGHQVDLTIADLVADARASTPSNAAELVLPERAAIESELATLDRRLERALQTRLDRARMQLERTAAMLGDPSREIQRRSRSIERLNTALVQAVGRRLATRRRELRVATNALSKLDPRARLAQHRRAFVRVEARLAAMLPPRIADARRQLASIDALLRESKRRVLASHRHRLETLAGQLDAMSPLRVLGRGYAIALRDGTAVTSAAETAVGDTLEIVLHQGRLRAEVKERIEQ
jgi:exodeoxyribonuclease VII large subunit